jgi:hypothetical protein
VISYNDLSATCTKKLETTQRLIMIMNLSVITTCLANCNVVNFGCCAVRVDLDCLHLLLKS